MTPVGARPQPAHRAGFWRRENGSSTVEFVLVLPLVLGLLLSSIDFGVVMLRQVFLDRAVDMAVRDVRLGRIRSTGLAEFRSSICNNVHLLPNCESTLTIDLRPVDTTTFAGLDEPVRCVDRAQEINPVLTFDPARGRQELMMIRVCVVADPFLRATGLVLGMATDASGGYAIVSRSAFANEPA
ncbi:MAG: pilus assembly protein [Pararhodobacter sp.]|nr:pilus assembly protein [Pararhodobacter sp.]